MLHTDPVPRLESKGHARIFQQRPSLSRTHPDGREYNTEAFHWGSLTTGHWLTSLWVLLAPFAFANVAGWMATSRSPLRRSLIRLACLALTALFMSQIGYVAFVAPFAYISGQQWATQSTLRWVAAGLSTAYVLVFGAIVLRLSAQSHFAPLRYRDRFRLLFSPAIRAMSPDPDVPDWGDPGDARITDPVMWDVHSMVHRLRRIHFAAGLFVAALAMGRMAESDSLINVALGGLGVVVTTCLLTTHVPSGRTGLLITRWISLLAEAVAVIGVVAVTMAPAPLDLVAIHRTTFEIAIALGVTGALCLVAGFPVVGALTFGTLFGGALGVGAGLIAEDLLSIEGTLIDHGAAWVAPAALIFLFTLAAVALFLTFRQPPPIGNKSPGNSLLTRITRKSRFLLTVAAIFGLISGALAFIQGCLWPGATCRPEELAILDGIDTLVAVFLVGLPLIVGIRFWTISIKVSAIAFVIAGLLAYVLGVRPTWGTFEPASYLEALPLSRTFIFIAPVAAIARSVLGAYRQGASSRKVGVLWDVASFWPRWYHPLAPPAYGPFVVTSLRKHIETGSVDVLAAHSQGSVIAAVATYQAVAKDGLRPRGLITYGSPIEMLYGKLFPDVGIDDLTLVLPDGLERGWVNLWRTDDPIGGKPLGGRVSDMPATGSGHSGYELTPAYRQVRDQLA